MYSTNERRTVLQFKAMVGLNGGATVESESEAEQPDAHEWLGSMEWSECGNTITQTNVGTVTALNWFPRSLLKMHGHKADYSFEESSGGRCLGMTALVSCGSCERELEREQLFGVETNHSELGHV